MASAASPGAPESRHSIDWYAGALEGSPMAAGDRMFIACEGGPCRSRLETFPPRLEIEEVGGLYVLFDDGPVEDWKYEFLPTEY